ncbi:MAG: hypothetical protein EZS28_002402 [Streblomastix strix]|uniref:Reverse transcriptase domain-containing protein n=1 Tax=Streblomastix strix TaxID=222440 RepID=A0A5J4X4B6_9EUKA|nr:MAG: hypothetical protein EZS28_002402 [Streblomastix strix]
MKSPLTKAFEQIGGKLQAFSQAWDKIGSLDLMRQGAQANWLHSYSKNLLYKSKQIKEFKGNRKEEELFHKALQEEIDQGIVIEVNPQSVKYLNKTFIIPKKDGRIRKILDCRQVNQQLGDLKYKSEDFRTVYNIAQRGDYGTTLDISSAYNHILVSDELQQFLAFQFKGKTYTYRGMPFGLKTAPFIFHKHLLPAIT